MTVGSAADSPISMYPRLPQYCGGGGAVAGGAAGDQAKWVSGLGVRWSRRWGWWAPGTGVSEELGSLVGNQC